MFDIKDFSNWKMCDGFPEGSGRSEKRWIKSDEGAVGLFKWPKIDPDTRSNTFEHISEHLAYQMLIKYLMEKIEILKRIVEEG